MLVFIELYKPGFVVVYILRGSYINKLSISINN
jgi:hypothetical protein